MEPIKTIVELNIKQVAKQVANQLKDLIENTRITFNLRAKIILITVGILFSAVGINTIVSSYIFTREYSEALQAQTLVIAQSLTFQLDRLLRLEIPITDIVGFEEQCQDVVNKYEEISYAMVVDTDGTILFHNDPSQHGIKLTDSAIHKAIRSTEDVIQVYSNHGEEYYDIATPVLGIHGERVATVRIGFPVRIITQKTEGLVAYSIGGALISLFLGTILLIGGVSVWVTAPLLKLMAAIQVIRRKGTDAIKEVEIDSQDEIGQLAFVFNQMISDLRQSHNEIKRYTEELESTVEKRTLELRAMNQQLQLDIIERKRAEKQIKASLKEKEVLLQEIHHRVKNNLQVISSLLSLQSDYVEDQQAREIFQDSQNRVRSMALVHEKLYRSQDLVGVDFAEYVKNLAAYLIRSYQASSGYINLMVNVENVYQSIDKAVPCGLIINELVSNSLKHAFPNGQGGEVYIELYKDCKDIVTLIIGDNGVGISTDMDSQDTTSLGLQLVKNLVNQLDGTIELKNEHGTEFKITFPN